MVKKKSKVIVPSNGRKDNLQAFRCDDQLKELLDGLENKSEFILEALWEKFKKGKLVTCPTCKGKGKIRA